MEDDHRRQLLVPASVVLCSKKPKREKQNTGEIRAERTVPDCKSTNMPTLPRLLFLIGDFGGSQTRLIFKIQRLRSI